MSRGGTGVPAPPHYAPALYNMLQVPTVRHIKRTVVVVYLSLKINWFCCLLRIQVPLCESSSSVIFTPSRTPDSNQFPTQLGGNSQTPE